MAFQKRRGRPKKEVSDKVIKTSVITVNDVLEELSNENKRLLNELLFANKYLKTLITFKTFVEFISNKFKTCLTSNELKKFKKLLKDIKGLKQTKNLNDFTESVEKNNKEVVKCESCLQLFISSDDYKRHLKVHTNSSVKPFVCYIPCGRSFSSLQDLKYHSNECHSHHSNRLKAINQKKSSFDSNSVSNQMKESLKTKSPKKLFKITKNVVNDNQNIDNSDNNSDDGRHSDGFEYSNDSDYIPPKTPPNVWEDDSDSIHRSSESSSSDRENDHNSNEGSDSSVSERNESGTESGLKVIPKNKLIKCPINGCNQTFVGRLPKQHLKVDHKDSELKCSVDGCTQTFERCLDFIRHLWTHPSYQLEMGPKAGVVKPYFKTEIKNSQTLYVCTIEKCGKRFAKYRYISDHYRKLHKQKQIVLDLKSKTRNKLIKCPINGCNKTFFGRLSRQHLLGFHKNSELNCSVDGCNQSFDSYLEFIKHLGNHPLYASHLKTAPKSGVEPLFRVESERGNSFYICTIEGCGKRFARYCDVSQHIKKTHKQTTLKVGCEWPECDHRTKTKSEMRLHFKNSHIKGKGSGLKMYVCDYKDCGVVSMGNKAYEQHIKGHKDCLIKCEWIGCGFQCKTFGQLAHHRMRHTNKSIKQLLCEHCNKEYLTPVTLRDHINRIHPKSGQTFKCDFKDCDKTFNSTIALNRHNYLHKDRPKPFKCYYEGCSVAVSYKSKLKRHLATHQAPQLACNWPGCEYKAKLSSQLKNHEWVHKPDVARYVCEWPECGKTIRHKTNFTFHMRAHLNDKRYSCEWPGCEFRCIDHWTIKRHRKSHSN